MMPQAVLPIMTPSGRSKSFANPNIMKTANRYLVTYFMPKEGNFEHEAGDLIYFIDNSIESYENDDPDSILFV